MMKYDIENMDVSPMAIHALLDEGQGDARIGAAFMWDKTPQGYGYWADVASKKYLDVNDKFALQEILKQYDEYHKPKPKFKVGDKVQWSVKAFVSRGAIAGHSAGVISSVGPKEGWTAKYDYLINDDMVGIFENEIELEEDEIEPTLYIIMRTDIQDMNPGKAAAQAAHAQADAEAFMKYEAKRYIKHLYDEWKGDLNFGRTLVVQADQETIKRIVHDHNLSGLTVDPTYPWKNYQGTTFTSFEITCAWAFVHPKDLRTSKSSELSELSLMP